MKKNILFIILAVMGSTVWPRPSLAQDTSLRLITSPLPINLITEPGKMVSTQLKIKNGGDMPEDLVIGMMKFSAFGEEGKPRLMEREPGDDYFDWVTFSEPEFTLNPNGWKTITATFNPPESASFGYYYAITFSRKNNEIEGGPRSTKVIGATSCLVLLEVRVPLAVREVEVLEFSLPQKVYEFLPVKFTVKLKNKGNVHVAPKGNIFIDRGSQKDVAILNINGLKGNVLPDSNRIFESEWNDGFPVWEVVTEGDRIVTDAHGKEKTRLKWDFSRLTRLRFGRYTANMLLAYDDGEKDVPIEGSLSFWVIPWRIIGVGGVLLLLILRGLWVTVRDPVRKIILKIKHK